MEITFVRVNERQCYSVVLRDDGVTVRVPGYGHVEPGAARSGPRHG